MYINAKIVALGGLMLAFTEVFISLGSVIESNTLFFLAAASFMAGIMIREAGLKAGAGFWAAGVLLGALIAPDKFYVLTYAGMSLYILLREIAWEEFTKVSKKTKQILKFWLIKLVIFNAIYLAGIWMSLELFVSKEINWYLVLGIVLAGQIGFWIYDMAYEYVQRQIWTKIRNKLL